MSFRVYRPRQAFGLVYILMYSVIFFTYVFLLDHDQSWVVEPRFTATLFLWFTLSLAVKISMLMDRIFELLNLISLLAFMSIAFFYFPQPGYMSSIEKFGYYLTMIGGPLCDLFDFIYEAVAKRSEDKI